ncbi:conserved hypothetical protein [uncultured Sporomusa sp.]|uniref:Phosphomevalonate dehydratase large subunit-like domain-containing protein n=1 Tax=uncultured Sporomusa sp. TaxID=307249 RepID=A0A212LWB3_9FIRM|nr:aconitase X catalytic domain-containing protein [uncultured Sporomusa sp.]SCM81833.1 conserved hypothetical protein [uncultured Sporomusa sp.]
MVILTDYEQRMLDGEFGEFKQIALQKIVDYANALGAEELCEVKKATLYLGAHPYLETAGSDDYDVIFSKMYLCSDKTVPLGEMADCCFCQTCVAPCDQYQWESLYLSKEFFDRNRKYLELTRDAGVSITGSCTPYLVGWIPLKGEHFVTTESSNVVMCNSVFGACGNSDGIEAAAWSAVCGRTPKWGFHVPENRYGTIVFNIECAAETAVDWDIIGYTVGRKLPPHGVPVLQGNYPHPDIIRLKQCFAAMATTSGAEMCHIVGFTPEAPDLKTALGGKEPKAVITITEEDYRESLDMLCDRGESPINIVALGCPHYTLEEIRAAALYIKGKTFDPSVDFAIWTDYATREMASQNGYLKIVEAAGGQILSSACPLVIGHKYFKHAVGFVADGAKQAHYIRSELPKGTPVYYGDMFKCIDAAVRGSWKEVK